MKHISIFSKERKYETDPISEYKKLNKYIDKYYTDFFPIRSLFERYFCKSKILKKKFADFDDCIFRNTQTIHNFIYGIRVRGKETGEEIAAQIFDEYLTYCELLSHFYYIALSYEKSLINNEMFVNTMVLIKESLKSFNHKIKFIDKKENTVVAIKINPEAEAIAENSSSDIRTAIYQYLGSRDSEMDKRRNKLQDLIDLLEPLLDKYQSLDIVKKIKRYVQLLRHPETKKTNPMYK